MLLSNSQAGRPAAVVGLAGVLLLSAAGWSRAALTEGRPMPSAAPRPVMLAQAPAPPAPNVEANIGQLHQRLQITPAQEPQFQALANIMRQNAQTMSSAAPPTSANAVEGLRLAIHYGQQEIDGMKRMLPALQALYASLSPTQRQIADSVFRQGPGE
ncbi:MAG: Spy/CpxP family protein refolding chaperone [Stellaceae bacterium]